MCLAVPGRVVVLAERNDAPMAEVDFGGVRKEVCLQYLPEVTIGDYVIVHVGFAIQRLDERSALETLAAFAGMGLLDEELGAGDSAAGDGAVGDRAAGDGVAGDGVAARWTQSAQEEVTR